MPRELFANDASSSLSAAITSTTATSISVTSAANFPASGNFRLIIGSEVMICTAVSGTTLTVTRGAEGTTAQTALNGATVTHILTKGSTQRFLRDNVPLADDSNRPPFALLDASGNTLTSSNFTIVNGGIATVTDQVSGAIAIRKTKLSSSVEDVTFLARSAPATPYQVYAAMEGAFLDPTEFSGMGIGFRESSSGKLVVMVLGMNAAGIFPELAIYNFTNPTTYSGTAVVSRFCALLPSPKWFSVSDNGTTLTFYASHDGIIWITVGSVARTSYMTGGPDSCGFCVSSSLNTSYDIAASLLAWQE